MSSYKILIQLHLCLSHILHWRRQWQILQVTTIYLARTQRTRLQAQSSILHLGKVGGISAVWKDLDFIPCSALCSWASFSFACLLICLSLSQPQLLTEYFTERGITSVPALYPAWWSVTWNNVHKAPGTGLESQEGRGEGRLNRIPQVNVRGSSLLSALTCNEWLTLHIPHSHGKKQAGWLVPGLEVTSKEANSSQGARSLQLLLQSSRPRAARGGLSQGHQPICSL